MMKYRKLLFAATATLVAAGFFPLEAMAMRAAAPSRGAPSRGAPFRGAPSRGAPSRGAPSRGAPSRGAPQPLLKTPPLPQPAPLPQPPPQRQSFVSSLFPSAEVFENKYAVAKWFDVVLDCSFKIKKDSSEQPFPDQLGIAWRRAEEEERQQRLLSLLSLYAHGGFQALAIAFQVADCPELGSTIQNIAHELSVGSFSLLDNQQLSLFRNSIVHFEIAYPSHSQETNKLFAQTFDCVSRIFPGNSISDASPEDREKAEALLPLCPVSCSQGALLQALCDGDVHKANSFLLEGVLISPEILENPGTPALLFSRYGEDLTPQDIEKAADVLAFIRDTPPCPRPTVFFSCIEYLTRRSSRPELTLLLLREALPESEEAPIPVELVDNEFYQQLQSGAEEMGINPGGPFVASLARKLGPSLNEVACVFLTNDENSYRTFRRLYGRNLSELGFFCFALKKECPRAALPLWEGCDLPAVVRIIVDEGIDPALADAINNYLCLRNGKPCPKEVLSVVEQSCGPRRWGALRLLCANLHGDYPPSPDLTFDYPLYLTFSVGLRVDSVLSRVTQDLSGTLLERLRYLLWKDFDEGLEEIKSWCLPHLNGDVFQCILGPYLIGISYRDAICNRNLTLLEDLIKCGRKPEPGDLRAVACLVPETPDPDVLRFLGKVVLAFEKLELSVFSELKETQHMCCVRAEEFERIPHRLCAELVTRYPQYSTALEFAIALLAPDGPFHEMERIRREYRLAIEGSMALRDVANRIEPFRLFNEEIEHLQKQRAMIHDQLMYFSKLYELNIEVGDIEETMGNIRAYFADRGMELPADFQLIERQINAYTRQLEDPKFENFRFYIEVGTAGLTVYDLTDEFEKELAPARRIGHDEPDPVAQDLFAPGGGG
ncbi:MAG: hypothetical protein LBD15_04590 [Holosporales bacterium]|nr:hypothetical protein [Holosporales bacterium]